MKVLSLFDGISCGRVALERAGIPVGKYYRSEIDKYADQIAKKNYPDSINMGDVRSVVQVPDIDLLIAGSPCQGFSFAGKQLNFDDPRSKLFFDFVRILKASKPKYFLLENVMMKKEFQDVISGYLGVEPIMINSALVSAQNRKRLYWTNIPGVEQPEDKKVLLRDVVFYDALFVCGFNRKEGVLNIKEKSYSLNASDWRGLNRNQNQNAVIKKDVFPICMHNLYGGFNEKKHRAFLEKSPTIRTAAGGGHIPSLLLSDKALDYMDREVKGGRTYWDFKHHSDVRDEKSASVVANFFKGVPYNVLKDWECIRKFDPVECERLQTLEDNYTAGVSNTQRFKALGNGWTVDVIAHIFKGLK